MNSPKAERNVVRQAGVSLASIERVGMPPGDCRPGLIGVRCGGAGAARQQRSKGTGAMARNKKQWRRWRRHLRALLFTVLLLGALPGLTVSLVFGQFWGLFLIPVGMAAAVVATPFAIVGLGVGLLTLVLPLLVLGAVFGGPLYLVYRLLDGRQRVPALEGAGITPEGLLRRRYVAGEITYAEFQDSMLVCLKERFARGEIALAQYEAELDKLLQPARRLDVARDPFIAGTLPGR